MFCGEYLVVVSWGIPYKLLELASEPFVLYTIKYVRIISFVPSCGTVWFPADECQFCDKKPIKVKDVLQNSAWPSVWPIPAGSTGGTTRIR